MRIFPLSVVLIACASLASAAPPPGDASGMTATQLISRDANGINLNGHDGSTQARVGTQTGSVEFPHLIGGVTGSGATLFCDSDAATDVNCNIVAKNNGMVTLGNFYGGILNVQPANTGTANFSWTVTSATTNPGLFIVPSTGTINAGIGPGGSGYFTLKMPDGTNTGGNERGSSAVDLMLYRTDPTQVCSGQWSFCAGAASIAAGIGSTVLGGYGNKSNGIYSVTSGTNANDGYRKNSRLHGIGYFVQPGDDQYGDTGLQGISTAGAAVTLTNDRAAPSATNCANVFQNSTIGVHLTLVGYAPGHHMMWTNSGMLTEDANAATAALSLGTPVTFGDSATVSVTANTSYGCIGATITPANGSYTWHYLMRVDTVEVR